MDEFEQLIGNEGVRVSEAEANALIATPNLNVYFGNRVCPFAHRAFWAATEVGFQMKYVHIDLGSRKPAWYASSVNRLGTVPCVFVEGGKGVFESMNVAEYMDEVCNGGLQPKSAFDKSVMRFVIARFEDTCKGAFYTVLMNQVIVCYGYNW